MTTDQSIQQGTHDPDPNGAGPVDLLLADREQLGETLDRFAAAFTALSGLLVAAPDAELVTRMRDAELLADWPLPDEGDTREGVELLRASAQADESVEVIRRDYNRLFFGPEPMIAPPYESVHRSQERLVFERETMQVRAAYAEFDLAAPRLNREPDDHIALELSFLSTLCVRAMDLLDAHDDASAARHLVAVRAFLAEHLLVWGPTCFEQAVDGATTSFYRGVARLGRGTLAAARTAFLLVP
ncbi:TorD/DmsD family molecular chaperone [Cellulomonas timonensis]|uniref:TorD/DmsD family molecular chaperone n=1 Tax=Cellulomonas timonensis TaxID=1689271 RepID=UPI000837772C|nr:molecular chaperone TorD family protein [Cellulomonas timonensis]